MIINNNRISSAMGFIAWCLLCTKLRVNVDMKKGPRYEAWYAITTDFWEEWAELNGAQFSATRLFSWFHVEDLSLVLYDLFKDFVFRNVNDSCCYNDLNKSNLHHHVQGTSITSVNLYFATRI